MTIVMMYATLLVPIIAGIINSIFCKSNLFLNLKVPIDRGKKLKDSKRLFGDNKTIKGFLGYIVFNIIVSIILGVIFNIAKINNYNFFYTYNDNTILFNLYIGFLLGLFYALFELPNSFIKRRIDIKPGKNPTGKFKLFFIILDQADSVFGVALVVWMFYPLGIKLYLLYIALGVVTHLLINMMLYFLHLRKNMF